MSSDLPEPVAIALLAQATARPLGSSTSAPTLLREQVYERIRDWIVEGHLPPDTRLRDIEIADALQVSRTPVREAIRRLEDEGLVVAEASRWTRVAPLDTGTADRLYPIIWTLERLAISLADVAWDLARIGLLESKNAELAQALSRGDARAASEADTAFHRQFVLAADNAELTAIVDDLKVRLRRIEIAYFGGAIAGELSLDEHERIIEALRDGDLGRAQDALEHNWRKSLERLQERRRRD